MASLTETFLEQLRADSRFLKSDRRLDTEVVDRLILQLNRIYPQVLSDNEAKKVTHHSLFLPYLSSLLILALQFSVNGILQKNAIVVQGCDKGQG